MMSTQTQTQTTTSTTMMMMTTTGMMTNGTKQKTAKPILISNPVGPFATAEEREDAMLSSLGLTRQQLLHMTSKEFDSYRKNLQSTHELTEEQKVVLQYQRRTIKNREYAQTSRQKKKNLLSVLEARVQVLEDENSSLSQQNIDLQSKLIQLANTFRSYSMESIRQQHLLVNRLSQVDPNFSSSSFSLPSLPSHLSANIFSSRHPTLSDPSSPSPSPSPSSPSSSSSSINNIGIDNGKIGLKRGRNEDEEKGKGKGFGLQNGGSNISVLMIVLSVGILFSNSYFSPLSSSPSSTLSPSLGSSRVIMSDDQSDSFSPLHRLLWFFDWTIFERSFTWIHKLFVPHNHNHLLHDQSSFQDLDPDPDLDPSSPSSPLLPSENQKDVSDEDLLSTSRLSPQPQRPFSEDDDIKDENIVIEAR